MTSWPGTAPSVAALAAASALSAHPAHLWWLSCQGNCFAIWSNRGCPQANLRKRWALNPQLPSDRLHTPANTPTPPHPTATPGKYDPKKCDLGTRGSRGRPHVRPAERLELILQLSRGSPCPLHLLISPRPPSRSNQTRCGVSGESCAREDVPRPGQGRGEEVAPLGGAAGRRNCLCPLTASGPSPRSKLTWRRASGFLGSRGRPQDWSRGRGEQIDRLRAAGLLPPPSPPPHLKGTAQGAPPPAG